MNLSLRSIQRLEFLSRVVRKQCQHLVTTDTRLFAEPLTLERVKRLEEHIDLAECVDAFVSRFGRLQDTLGDKLLPAVLEALGERRASATDNLDIAERLGFVESADGWFTLRHLRNQMVHEYVEDPAILQSALQSGHEQVSTLKLTAERLLAEVDARLAGLRSRGVSS